MDPLSDLLRVVRLDGAFFYAVEASNPWKVETEPSRRLSPLILPAAEHLIPYHVITTGACYAGLVGEPPAALVAGDVILFPHGGAHVLSSGQDPGAATLYAGPSPARHRETVKLGPGGQLGATFVCGFLGIERQPFNPLLASLPRQLHMRGMANAWRASFTNQVIEESQRGRAGAECVLTRLAELMFIEVLRRYLDEIPAGQTGWLAALRDETVGGALTLLHSQPTRPWTLADLARAVASSRSSLARRFADLVGQPPMQYLTSWRMQLAASHLAQSGAKIATIGRDVGYASEAAFSRAFKKATGQAPGAWRETRRTIRE
jgi:AraC-like DNA-binding protein